MRLGEIRAGRSIGGGDCFGEKVEHFLVFVFWQVSGVKVIETAIFADDDDDVLDWRGGLDLVDGLVRISSLSRQTEAKNRETEHQCASDGLRRPLSCASHVHISLLVEINCVGDLTGNHDSRIKVASQLRESFL